MNTSNPESATQPPVVLTIAGSDSSSGAGIQADLKTFSYFQCHGLTAVTCVVAETPELVESIHSVSPSCLQDQLEILLNTYPVQAIKTGMLYSKAHLVAAYELLQDNDIPLVVDPVMVATSLPGDQDRTDILYHEGKIHHFTSPMIDIACTHGTGCTLSAAITSQLAHGLDMVSAVSTSRDWVHTAIKDSFQWKSPSSNSIHCLNHLRG